MRSISNSFLMLLAFLICLSSRTSLAFSPQSNTRQALFPSSSLPFVRQSRQSSSFSRLFNGPAILDRPETIEINEVEKKSQQQEKIGGEAWEIRLFNDPFNKREFVARCLSEVCGKSDTESYQIMMQAHRNGDGISRTIQF